MMEDRAIEGVSYPRIDDAKSHRQQIIFDQDII